MMDGNSRILNRIRPRPYDLRRKVLLKNFLREQMTYIPPVRGLINTSVEVSSDNDSSPEVTTSIGNEENMETSDIQPKHAQSDFCQSEPSTSAVVDEIEPNSETSFSNTAITDNIPESDKVPRSKFSRLSALLRLKSVSRKRRKRGISKAKRNYKSIKSPIKLTSQLEDTAKKNNGATVHCKKSFFEVFKFRRGIRRMTYGKKDLQHPSSNEPSNKTSATSDQSIQTDISLLSETYNNELEQTNKNLQEENRLLSESLSYIMSDINFKINSKRKSSECTDSYSNTTVSDYKMPTDNEDQNLNETRNCTFELSKTVSSNTKLFDSKSVQEKCSVPKIRLRTKSNVLTESPKIIFNASPKLPGFRNSYPNRPQNLNTTASEFSRQTVLKNLPINSSKTIIRRSSMPERTYREPIRTLLRPRSNSTRVINYGSNRKQNQHASSSHSSGSFSSKKQMLTNVRKPIIRRSSMPERISHNHCRPLYRHRSINGRDFSSVTSKSYSRPGSVGEYSRSASFQNLPNEAFY